MGRETQPGSLYFIPHGISHLNLVIFLKLRTFTYVINNKQTKEVRLIIYEIRISAPEYKSVVLLKTSCEPLVCKKYNRRHKWEWTLRFFYSLKASPTYIVCCFLSSRITYIYCMSVSSIMTIQHTFTLPKHHPTTYSKLRCRVLCSIF